MPKGEDMTIKTYSDCFWGGDLTSQAGYSALAQRNSDGKKICQDYEDYLKKRSKIEADYSKQLSSLTKCFRDREALGVMEAVFNTLKMELENMAKSHARSANYFQEQADAVKKFKEEQTTRRKQLEESLTKAQNNKQSQYSKTVQCEKIYHKKYMDRDLTEKSYREMNNPQTLPKELEKVRIKAVRAQEDAEKSDSSYRSAVMVLEDCRVQWEKEMVTVCKSIQELDEERLSFLRENVWMAVNEDSQIALETDQSCESVREILEKCDIVSDIQAFIQTAGTGDHHPEPYIFHHYMSLSDDKDRDSDSNGSDSFNPYSTVEEENRNSQSASQVVGLKGVLGKLKKKSTS